MSKKTYVSYDVHHKIIIIIGTQNLHKEPRSESNSSLWIRDKFEYL